MPDKYRIRQTPAGILDVFIETLKNDHLHIFLGIVL